jgi:hypothetical protein
MIFRTLAPVICACLGLVFSAAANAGYSKGQCGAPYTAQDGRSYACGPNRKPYCDQSNGRCQCLERKECPGGKQDEEW